MSPPSYTTILLHTVSTLYCIHWFDLFVSKTMSPPPYTTILLHPLHSLHPLRPCVYKEEFIRNSAQFDGSQQKLLGWCKVFIQMICECQTKAINSVQLTVPNNFILYLSELLVSSSSCLAEISAISVYSRLN